MIMQIALVVGVVLTGINGFMIGRLWERERGDYRKRYDLLSKTIDLFFEVSAMNENLEQQRLLSPVQVGDL